MAIEMGFSTTYRRLNKMEKRWLAYLQCIAFVTSGDRVGDDAGVSWVGEGFPRPFAL